MLEGVPLHATIIFVLTTIITVFLFYKASGKSKNLLYLLLAWIAVQSILSSTLFYTNTGSIPPRVLLLVGPMLIGIILLFITKPGKEFVDGFNIKTLTWLHIIRIPVELVLLHLFQSGKIPELMTFEGRNFDIISGISAPFIAWFAFKNNQPNKTVLLVWNFICLALLLNIVIYGIGSVPTPFQQFSFVQPNIGLLYFPFTLLPGLIVPIVLLAHLTTIRKLILSKQ